MIIIMGMIIPKLNMLRYETTQMQSYQLTPWFLYVSHGC